MESAPAAFLCPDIPQKNPRLRRGLRNRTAHHAILRSYKMERLKVFGPLSTLASVLALLATTAVAQEAGKSSSGKPPSPPPADSDRNAAKPPRPQAGLITNDAK